MKKVFYIILSLLLVGCVDNNIIEVKHSEDYTSEIIGEIKLYNKNSYVSTNFCEIDVLCIQELNEDIVDKTYLLDLHTHEIRIQEEIVDDNEDVESDSSYEFVVYNQDFKIFFTTNQIDSVYTETFYYEKDGIKTKIFEYQNDSRKPSEDYKHIRYVYTDTDFYFFKPNETHLISYKVNDGKLEEVDRILIKDNGYLLKDISSENEGLCMKYENDEAYRYILNNEELILKKNDNGNELKEYYIEDITPKRLVYKKDGMITLHLEDEVYDLGYNANYQIRDNYIISTAWNDGFSEKATILIDRNTDESYVLSETYDISRTFFYNQNLYFTRDLNNQDTPYTLLKIDQLDVTAISLPFTVDFELIKMINENTLLFKYQNDDVLQFYKVQIK